MNSLIKKKNLFASFCFLCDDHKLRFIHLLIYHLKMQKKLSIRKNHSISHYSKCPKATYICINLVNILAAVVIMTLHCLKQIQKYDLFPVS